MAKISEGSQVDQSRLTDLLKPGEQLLWRGRPAVGAQLRLSDIFMIPLELLFLYFTIFWANIFPIASVIIAYPLWVLADRFFYDAWRRKHTLYGLTTERIIIVGPWSVKSFNFAILPKTSIKQSRGGRGSIFVWEGDDKGATKTLLLEGIDDAMHVYSMIMTEKKRLQQKV